MEYIITLGIILSLILVCNMALWLIKPKKKEQTPPYDLDAAIANKLRKVHGLKVLDYGCYWLILDGREQGTAIPKGKLCWYSFGFEGGESPRT